ncbi:MULTISPECIES: ligase-associated DNA damage response endonuclease PdeM [Massilia]|uniref:DEAD/DEAH box helicase n=1 Tax=Massilia aurea TaxID=373040 RepID=A0A422QFL4_9BURK|nr:MULTISPECIES: ligase-associated DNA damage response endonuclease PdeM [Massilia]MDY0963587.1 ligase-associated DNA damage response endonuclease PdeM [Massilia sp. CFBP9026]RNF28812.1 DEAD/DEAH box helicase [Massilia aurea]
MSGVMVEVAGESLLLLPEKAIYWPRERMLIIADIHFGKAAAFRALGVPVPRGTTSENLAGLDALVAAHGVRQVAFLGDFLHARAAHASSTQLAMLAWRGRHPDLALMLVRGNHDLHAGDPAAALGMALVDEPHAIGPFAFCHHPGVDAAGYGLAGHVHPVYVLATRFDALRLPCFVVGEQGLILPSFGAFTGGHAVKPGPGDHIYVTSGDAVHAVC